MDANEGEALFDPTGGYESFVAEFYDYVLPYRNRSDVDFYLERAQGAKGPVLELGCGTGRVLIPLARSGVEIVGLDLSSAMLGICVERLAREQESVRSRTHLMRADMRSFNLGRHFPKVFIPFRAFQHLVETREQLDCLACIHEHLNPGGELVLDLFNPSITRLAAAIEPEVYMEEPPFEMPDGRIVVRGHRIIATDPVRQVNQAEIKYAIDHPDGRKEELIHNFEMRYLFRYEAEHLLARAGFVVDEVFGAYDGSEFGSKLPGELILVAHKN